MYVDEGRSSTGQASLNHRMGCGYVRPLDLERACGSWVLGRQHKVGKLEKRIQRDASSLVQHHPAAIIALQPIQ